MTNEELTEVVGAISEDLNDKMDLDIQNAGIVYITETWHDTNGNWYRVYSDGWCEQGGIYTNQNSNSGSVTVNLHKVYKDTKYSVLRNPNIISNDASTHNYYDSGSFSKTTSSFDMYIQPSTYCSEYVWEAKGYMN